MARIAAIIGYVNDQARPILGTIGDIRSLRILASDRAANEQAFPGEQVVRLPRSIGRIRDGEDDRAAFRRVFQWWDRA